MTIASELKQINDMKDIIKDNSIQLNSQNNIINNKNKLITIRQLMFDNMFESNYVKIKIIYILISLLIIIINII